MINPRCGLLIALLIAVQIVAVGAEAFEKCIKPIEVEADQVRYIETQLRVAALQCKDHKHADLPLLYNAFILENRPYLVRTQKPLTSFLKRSGQPSVDTYITSVANRISIASSKVSQFCRRVKLAAELSAKTADPVKLLGLMPVEYQRPAAYCRKRD